jgi:hypothetical protein
MVVGLEAVHPLAGAMNKVAASFYDHTARD